MSAGLCAESGPQTVVATDNHGECDILLSSVNCAVFVFCITSKIEARDRRTEVGKGFKIALSLKNHHHLRASRLRSRLFRRGMRIGCLTNHVCDTV